MTNDSFVIALTVSLKIFYVSVNFSASKASSSSIVGSGSGNAKSFTTSNSVLKHLFLILKGLLFFGEKRKLFYLRVSALLIGFGGAASFGRTEMPSLIFLKNKVAGTCEAPGLS